MSDKNHHICPWWMECFFTSHVGQLYQKPGKIMEPYLSEGMRVLEIGPGRGFFTLPMARMVGERGKIYCIDIQQRMLNALRRRAKKAGIADRIEDRFCSDASLGIRDLSGTIDFAVAIAVVHKVPDSRMLFREILSSLNKKGKVLIAEPMKWVTADEFNATLEVTAETGLTPATDMPQIKGFRSVLLARRSEKILSDKKESRG
jgi:ubiquinone/menaquinone biosynthesis C-methylase UbiE